MSDGLISMFIGDDKDVLVYIRDPNGDPVDITSASVVWSVARNNKSAAILSKSTGGNGAVVTSGSGGLITVTLADTDTDSLAAGDYVYQTRITFSNGKEATMEPKTFRLNPRIGAP